MQINANNISHKIIQAHMKGLNLDLEKLAINKKFKYALFDSKQRAIHSQFSDHVDLSQKIFKTQNSIFYIDKGTTGHLAVSYVVIKENSLTKNLSDMKKQIIYITIGIYCIIVIVGFSLAKLFIYPIQSQREKLNTFIKDTTHELNTPISALLLSVNSEDFTSEKNRQYINLSAKKISNLYKDLTYITLKVDKPKSNVAIDIAQVLTDELPYHKQLAEKKKITISSEVEQTFFKIDKEDYIRITNNLISNAIKYTKRNGQISITLKNSILKIQDNGIGIEKNKLDKIYERYYRATQSVGGFGIGLNIVYSICKKYNIPIKIESDINKGTTFYLEFNTQSSI